MALTETALAEAQDYAQECLATGREYARVVQVRMLVNGYDVTDKRSEEFYGYAVETLNATGTDTLVILHNGEVPSAERSLFIIDNGRTVTARYVAGWNVSQRAVYLHPFPTAWDVDGNPVMRADRAEQVDYSSWVLNPHRAYHVKLSTLGE